MKNEPYIAALNGALLSFQMIEEALKICVGLSYEIIRATAPSPIVFRFNPVAVVNAPLGKLIKMFSEVTANDELVNDLRKVIEWRNFCAHNAFAHEFLNRASKSPFKSHPAEDVKAIVKFSANLVERLGNEMKLIREIHVAVIEKKNKSLLTKQAPNNWVNQTAGSSVALIAASSVAAAGYPWRLQNT